MRKQPTSWREEIYHFSRCPSNLNKRLCDRAKSAASRQTDGLWPDIDSGLPELSFNQEMKTKGRDTIKCTWMRREGQSGQFSGTLAPAMLRQRKDDGGETTLPTQGQGHQTGLTFPCGHCPDSTSPPHLLLHWETPDESTTCQPGIQFALYINKMEFNIAANSARHCTSKHSQDWVSN